MRLFVMMRQVFPAQFIQRALRLGFPEADEFLGQFRIGAGIGFINKFVIARQSVDTHLEHRGGDAKPDRCCR